MLNNHIGVIDAAKLQQIVEQCLPDINTVRDKELVLVIGRTKSGKSTAINYLMGAQLVKYTDDDGLELVKLAEGEVEYVPIGATMENHTLAPRGCTNANQGITYCDTVGFDDNRSQEDRICATSFMQAGIHVAAAIKMLAVTIDVGLLYTDPCARDLRALAEMLSNITNDITNFSQNLVFILTKANTPDRLQVIARIKKLQKTLEQRLAAEQEAIEKLVQIFAANDSETDEFRKRKNEMHLIQSQISIIKLISAENTFLLNIFDNGETRQILVSFFQERKNLDPIPKETLNFERLNQDWSSFSKEVEQLASNASNLIGQRLSLPAELWHKKENLVNLSKRINYLERQHPANLNVNHRNNFAALRGMIRKHRRCLTDIMYLQKLITFLNSDTTLIRFRVISRGWQEESKQSVMHERVEKATDEFWYFYRDCNFNNETAKSERDFFNLELYLPSLSNLLPDEVWCEAAEYTDDVPLPKRYMMTFNDGHSYDALVIDPIFRRPEASVLKDGMGNFKALFQGTARRKIQLYAFVRNFPDTPGHIRNLNQSIERIQQTLKNLEYQMVYLKKFLKVDEQNTFLEEIKNHSTPQLKWTDLQELDKWADCNTKCHELTSEITALETTLSSVKEQMNASTGMHAILFSIAPLLAPRTISEFFEKYTIYKQLSAQERDDGLFLAMRKFYIEPDTINWSPEFLQKLGSGRTADVYKGAARGIDNVAFVAIKKIFALTLTPKLVHEAKLMAQFSRHPNIIKFYGITQSRQSPTASYAIVMECMKYSLEDILYKLNIPDNELPIEWRIKISLQIIEAIMYLHEAAFIHCDIKSPNILLSEERQTAKLTDFGLSKPIAEIIDTDIGSGTPCWMAPELSKTAATKATDIFAFGIVLAEMVNRKLPFDGNMDEYNQYQQKIQAGLLVFSNQFPALSSLGKNCTKVLPHERPTAQQCRDQLTNFRQ